MREPIEKVIERCEYRIERALDCNIDDIRRLIAELQELKPKPRTLEDPIWHGLGTGD